MNANEKLCTDISIRVTDAIDILKLIEDRDGRETEIVSLAVAGGAAGAARRILDEVVGSLEDLGSAIEQLAKPDAEAQP